MISTPRPRYVQIKRARGREYLYAVKGDHRLPLRGPIGSEAFRLDYEAALEIIERGPKHEVAATTVAGAILDYLRSADFKQLSPGTQEDYRRMLDGFRERWGAYAMASLDVTWVEALRDRYAASPQQWNALRSRMREIARRFRRRYPDLMPLNPWEEARRLKVEKSDQNRAWPLDALRAVLMEATPEFRAVVLTLLLTGQRIGDVVSWGPERYDPARRTLRHRQEKTDAAQLLHVPEILAGLFEQMRGRHSARLLVTPRGVAWTTLNAEETLLSIRARLGLPRYTLHGLRKTALSTLKMAGFENRWLRALSGHTSDRNLETYLDGVDHYPMARETQEALAVEFAPLIEGSVVEGNQRKSSGMTGRAAAKAGIRGESRRRKAATDSDAP